MRLSLFYFLQTKIQSQTFVAEISANFGITIPSQLIYLDFSNGGKRC